MRDLGVTRSVGRGTSVGRGYRGTPDAPGSSVGGSGVVIRRYPAGRRAGSPRGERDAEEEEQVLL